MEQTPSTMKPDQNSESELNRVKRELSILYDISNAMRTTLELNHILYIILTGVTSHTGLGFNRAILFLVNDRDRCLEPKMAIGPESGTSAEKIWNYIEKVNPHLEDLIDEENVASYAFESPFYQTIRHIKVPLGPAANHLAKAFHEGKPYLLHKDDLQNDLENPLKQVFESNEMVIVPLKAKDAVKGLIVADNIFNRKPITPDDMRMFVMLGNQAGLAIENSQLYEMIRHKSHTDALTGLWNHGFFQSQLTTELKKASTKKTPLSLLMIDLDDFKKLNDSLGHQTGDEILVQLAGMLKDSSREIDYVCRYGGEEFSMILTQTSKEQACTIAERIRDRVSNGSFSIKNIRLTVSIGIATYPEDSESKEELIALADKALYEAKFGGKNQISIA